MGFFYPLTWDTATWEDENAEDWTPNQKLGFLGSSSSLVGSYHGGPDGGPHGGPHAALIGQIHWQIEPTVSISITVLPPPFRIRARNWSN